MTSPLIDCGQRLGRVSLKQFSKATQKHGLGDCVNAVPVQAGTFKQNVALKTDRGEWIFRGCSHYSWQFPKERFFADLIARETIAPVPLPYFVDDSLDTFDYDYALMPRMPGVQLSDQAWAKTLSALEKKEIALELGRFLRDLQTYPAPFFGEYDEIADGVVSYGKMYSDEVMSRAETLIHRSNSVAVSVANSEVDTILGMLEKHLSEVNTSQPVIVMQDYKYGNMCVTKNRGKWKVTGLFDLMEARFGHQLEDLPRQYAAYLGAQRPDLASAFLAGYGLTDNDLGLFNCFMVVDRLIVWEYGVRVGKWWSEGETFSDWMQRYCLGAVPVPN